MFSLAIALLVGLCARAVSGQCYSEGVDIGNGGTYYINPASTAPFSIISAFVGTCTTSESPILTLPDNTQLTCSLITEATGVLVSTTWYASSSSVLVLIIQSD